MSEGTARELAEELGEVETIEEANRKAQRFSVGQHVEINCDRAKLHGVVGEVLVVDPPWVIVQYRDPRFGDMSAGFGGKDLTARPSIDAATGAPS